MQTSPQTRSPKFNVADIVQAHGGEAFNQPVSNINESAVRIGVFAGEFPFHKHDDVDELFYVIEGMLYLDLDAEAVELHAGEGVVVRRGQAHRTRTPERAVVMMVAAPDAPAPGSAS